MSEKMWGNSAKKGFRDEELVQAAGLVREAMLGVLPEPAVCDHEFSPEFQAKMERLFAKERVHHILHTVRRYAAAIILLILFTGGVVLAVDTEARASFFEWVKKVYENSIVYEFFGGAQEEGLPNYELGWVPEGYEAVDVYRDETTYSAVYMKVDDPEAGFVFDYHIKQEGDIYEILYDEEEYEIKKVNINGLTGDLFLSLVETETNTLVWLDNIRGVVISINGYLAEEDMLHIAENIFLCKTPK